jgi:hypothetical protein
MAAEMPHKNSLCHFPMKGIFQLSNVFYVLNSFIHSHQRRNHMKRTILSLLLTTAFLVAIVDSQVQIRVPRISQGAKVSQVIGLSEVSISYHRPGVKGREIWGSVVKYDEVWRAGANEPTLFTFSDDVIIEGKKIAAGTYRFVVIPAKSGDWTLIFNSETKNWGTIYEAKYDTLKLACKPEAGPNEEWMSFSFTDLTPASARVVLAWEKIRLNFKIEFNTVDKVQASLGTWQLLNNAARFALDNKMYLDKGLDWVERSIALDKNARNLQTKAELLAQTGKMKEAVTTAEESVKIAKEKDPKANTRALEKMIADWKSKM